jgi:hypothetical protein
LQIDYGHAVNDSVKHIPLYNGEAKFLAEALGCRLAQTFRNFETTAVAIARFWQVLTHAHWVTLLVGSFPAPNPAMTFAGEDRAMLLERHKP